MRKRKLELSSGIHLQHRPVFQKRKRIPRGFKEVTSGIIEKGDRIWFHNHWQQADGWRGMTIILRNPPTRDSHTVVRRVELMR